MIFHLVFGTFEERAKEIRSFQIKTDRRTERDLMRMSERESLDIFSQEHERNCDEFKAQHCELEILQSIHFG